MPTKLDNLIIPGGRFIQGSLTEKGEKDHAGVVIPPEKRTYFIGVAVPKSAPGLSELINKLWQMAATDYAQVPLVMLQINQGLAAKDFAWKIEDGDAPRYDKKTGQPKETPEYMKGCYIFKFSTQFELGCCDLEGRDIDRATIKRGDYIDVVFSSLVNGKVDDTAGIYLNPNAVRRLGFGEAISGGAPASAQFANKTPAYMPPGATQMPTAGAAVMPGTGMPPAGMPGTGMPVGMPPAGIPAAPPVAPLAPPPAPFPPAGWLAHPSAPGYFYAGNEVLSEADLRARFAVPTVPVGLPMAPAGIPAAPTGLPGAGMPTAAPSSGSYPQILGGMPGM